MGSAVLLHRSSSIVSARSKVSGLGSRGVLEVLDPLEYSDDSRSVLSSSWRVADPVMSSATSPMARDKPFDDCGREVSGVVTGEGSGDPSS